MIAGETRHGGSVNSYYYDLHNQVSDDDSNH
jgi:hypothetical protein